MERIYGIPVGEIEQLRASGADFKKLAERGVEIFFTQVFRDNFFHADMHPGNIFVELPDKYIAVDFGIVGTLSLSDQRYLAENFLAFFNRDYRKVAEMHVESGWVPSTTRIEEFEAASRNEKHVVHTIVTKEEITICVVRKTDKTYHICKWATHSSISRCRRRCRHRTNRVEVNNLSATHGDP